MAANLVHFEFPADDTSRAREFFGSLFGWSWQSFEGPIEYHQTEGAEPGGAVYPRQQGEQGPVIYFGSDDIDATVARVRELGGRADDKQPIPTVGWFARCWDTEGNPFSLYQNEPTAA
jgi:predicted enzyme related to lactoylglutathione lyase